MDYYIRTEYRNALPHLYRAFDLDSSFVAPLLYAAINHFNLNEWAAADSVLELAARFRDQLSPYYRDWLEYLRTDLDGDFERALRAIRRAAEAAPGSKAVYNRARMAGFTGRPQEAIDALATLDPARGPMRGWSGYWSVLAAAHGQLGDHERQLEIVLQGRREHSNDPFLLRNQAEALSALGRLEEFTEVLNDIDALPPRPGVNSVGATMAGAAMEHRAHGHPQAAHEVFQRAINWYESRPPDERAETSHRKWYGIALYEAERWDEAASVFGALAQEFPDSVAFRGALGVIAARRGDRELALRTSEWLQGVDQPYLSGSHTFIRARIAAVLGEQERAVALLREAAVQGSPRFLLHPAIDLTSLRDYPPFQELMRPKG